MQNTAYGMRISDWSSDVCSSDLLFKPGDEPVNARLGLEGEGVLHLVERGRDAVFLKVPVDEEQKLVLLFGEHGSPGPPVCRPSARQRPQNMEQNKNFHACSSLVLHHRQALLTAS